MNSQNKKTLQIVLIALIAVITLGIGYATINAINLIINGNATATVDQNNFKVKFLNNPGVTPTIEGSPANTISVLSDTTASFSISTLDRAEQSVTATYKVKNESVGIGAIISLQLTSTNTEYFKVTEHIDDDKLQAGEETTVTVKVEMLKTPIDDPVTTTVTATLTATAIENDAAEEGEPKEEVRPVPDPHVYSLSLNQIESPISGTTYQDFNSAKTAFGHPAAVAHIISEGVISESYVAFEWNNKVYYIRGGIDEEELQDKPVYDETLDTLKTAFGPNWENYCEENFDEYQYFTCSVDGLGIYVYTYGDVSAGGSNWDCFVNTSGSRTVVW